MGLIVFFKLMCPIGFPNTEPLHTIILAVNSYLLGSADVDDAGSW